MLYQPPLNDETQYFLSKQIGNAGFQLHWHYEIEIMYCLKGTISVRTGENEYNVEQGEYIIISSAVDHNLRAVTEYSELLIVEFGSALLGSSFNEFLNRSFETKPNNANIRVILDKLCALSDSDGTASRLLIKSLLYNLSALMLSEVANHELYGQKRESKLKRIMVIQPVLDYIAENYSEPITLKTAAMLTHYELKSFCRVFKSTTGIPFHQYLNTYRIEQACSMLNNRLYSINQTAKMCGIPQAKTFSRLFRQYTGMTPTEYRKKWIKD